MRDGQGYRIVRVVDLIVGLFLSGLALFALTGMGWIVYDFAHREISCREELDRFLSENDTPFRVIEVVHHGDGRQVIMLENHAKVRCSITERATETHSVVLLGDEVTLYRWAGNLGIRSIRPR